ncbi:MAG: ABC transporter ATP-binding protein [Muribaculaceae bacterium]|nr:ABC transporter ATP-binding protein [Muribaculaceae bacterium]
MRVEKLTTGYRSHGETIVVTKDINAVLNGGELTCLLGPNGSGKSTLMRTMAGFLKSIGGKVMIEGKELGEMENGEMAKKVSVVLTSRVEAPNITVREVVELGRSPYTGFFGKINKEDAEAAANAMEMVGIADLAGRRVSTLSDGERQKVMIAKALAQETPIILLDEPTAFLDYPSKVGIMMLLKRLAHESGKAVFLSTHDLEIALQIADSLWLMDKHKVMLTGRCAELSADGSVGRYFDNNDVIYDKDSRSFRVRNPE